MDTQLLEGNTVEESSQSMTVQGVHRQVQLIQQVMASEMKDGEHFGKVPGCGNKPSLLKAGAEKLCLLFKMAPRFKTKTMDLGEGQREIRITTELFHIISGRFLGEGVGSCSTMESKYRYRNQARRCPVCEAEAIIKGKKEYGGGWVCFAKKGGCGAKFRDGDPMIEDQPVGRVDNPDIADTYNTVLKMGKKRSLVDAVLTSTAASDIFTQDIEELVPAEPVATTPAPAPSNVRPSNPEPEPPPPNDETPYEEPPDEVESQEIPEPRKAPPVAKGAPPKDARRMKSAFEGAGCSTCHKKIAKGSPIVKTSDGMWVHDPACYR